ncbi:hypothetical protein N7462_002169 [Penicillium macrosclerotiorum]|uniref:uncharacterized protein n=1 Tax=Penicillium macrosclerotiorum TaxID=303699 RepID=UPI002546FB20|nr:uncharacterized protein N7462_002169 [Penicillium macrosclerotiorum]KAJ5692746.1 hypothetical protein N7462_002169 [Penicillium macrosclerotiorum]
MSSVATFETYTQKHPDRLPGFDPFTQIFNLSYPDGTIFQVGTKDVDVFIQYNVRICINYGTQLGASILLFVMLLLLTRFEKRTSSVFLLNSSALFFNIIRLLFQVIHFSTGFEHFYPYFSMDYSEVGRSAYGISIAGAVFQSLVVICVQASLVVQVQVICATIRRRYRWPLLTLSVTVALVAIAFRLAWMVKNCIAIMELSYMDSIWWLESACNIVNTVAVCFFCAVFVAKLGFALRQRSQLGVREFGPMKIIFVCGCQTMVIPAVFSITQYFVVVPELYSNLLTLVAISLPLSSIWASANLDQRRRDSDAPSPRRRNLWQSLAVGITGTTLNNTMSEKQASTSTKRLTNSAAAQTLCYSDHLMRSFSKQSQESETPLAIAVEYDIAIDRTQQKSSIV